MRISSKYWLSVLAIARELLTTPPLIASSAQFRQGGENKHVHPAVTLFSLSHDEGMELQWAWEEAVV